MEGSGLIFTNFNVRRNLVQTGAFFLFASIRSLADGLQRNRTRARREREKGCVAKQTNRIKAKANGAFPGSRWLIETQEEKEKLQNFRELLTSFQRFALLCFSSLTLP